MAREPLDMIVGQYMVLQGQLMVGSAQAPAVITWASSNGAVIFLTAPAGLPPNSVMATAAGPGSAEVTASLAGGGVPDTVWPVTVRAAPGGLDRILIVPLGDPGG